MNNIFIKYKSYLLVLFLPIAILVVNFSFLYKEKYLSCITKDFSLCINSKKYISSIRKFTFRYPNDYPVTFKTGDELKNEYGSDFDSLEWINFSNEFYPNAGGDRLGSIILEKNSTYKDIKEYTSKELSNSEISPKIEYVKIGGKDAVCSSLKEQPHSFNLPSENCFVIYKGVLYLISFDYNVYYHKLPVEYYKKAKGLILSTFIIN